MRKRSLKGWQIKREDHEQLFRSSRFICRCFYRLALFKRPANKTGRIIYRSTAKLDQELTVTIYSEISELFGL